MANNIEAGEAEAAPENSFVLLSNRDQLTEVFIHNFLEGFELKYGSFSHLPADSSLEARLALAEQELNSCSLLLGHRYNPIVKAFIKAQFEKHLNSKYGVIEIESESDDVLSVKYRTCFNAFVRDVDSVHFAAANRDLVKDLELREYFTLMFNSMATMKRKAGDNCLCLLVVGASTTGKTMLFESPVDEVSHVYTSEKGVGRFKCNGKSILQLHDVPIKVLVDSEDTEKLKGIARTETVNAKVHSETVTVKPIFILGTSNQLLYDHGFNFFKISRNVKNYFESNAQPTKKVLEADIEAVKYRFVEMMVRKKPTLPENSLPASGNFSRIHLIRGLYPEVLAILFKYRKENFGSQHVYIYAIFSLCKNFFTVPAAEKKIAEKKLLDLFVRYRLTDKQSRECIVYMAANS